MSTPAAASGSSPTGVSTEKRPPTSSGMTNVGYPSCVGERLQRPARLVGDGHDALRSLLLAVTLLDLGL